MKNGSFWKRLSLFFLFLILCKILIPQEIIESFRSFPVTLNPLLATDEVSISIADKVFSGLFTLDRNGNVVPDLVEEWGEEKNSIFIKLRDKILWHDGRSLTTDDLVFTINLMKDPSFEYPYLADIEFIKEIVKIDSKKAKIIFSRKFAPFLLYLTFKILPSHMKDACKKADSILPGTGPYKFKEVKYNQYLILERFEKYFRGFPEIKFYKLVVNPDPLMNPLKLLKEEVHVGEIEHEVYRSLIKDKEFNSKVSFIPYKKNSYTYLAFNLRNSLLNKEMRKGIAHAIPRDKILKNLLSGAGEIVNSHIIVKPWRVDCSEYKYSPEISKKLIRNLGWNTGKKGFFEKDGKVLKFVLVTNGESILRRYCAQIIKDELEKIGIEIEIKLLEYLSFRSALKNGNFDLAISGYLMDLDPNVWDLFSSKGVLNYARFSNPYLDELLIKGKETLYISERKKIYKEVQEILWDEIPIFPLFVPYYIMGVSKKVEVTEKPEIVGSTNSFSSFVWKWKFKSKT